MKGGVFMEISTITQFVSAVGFPIVMCIALLKMNSDKEKTQREESKEFTTALNNNTLVIQKLTDKLEKGE